MSTKQRKRRQGLNPETRRRQSKNIRLTLEPFEVPHDEAVRELRHVLDREVPDEKRSDEATLRAIATLGWRIVRGCNLCAERQDNRIPACPNVATVKKRATRGQGLVSGAMYECEPHSRGGKVYAKP